MALFLTEKDVKKLLTMDIALEAVEEGFRQQSEGDATNSPRLRLRLPNGDLNLMAAVAPGFGVMGMKTYGVTSGNLTKFYMQLWSIESGELIASMEASTLGQIRTGAASGVATKYMSRKESSSVGVIGSGYQARTQLEAVCSVRDVRSVKVFSRTLAHMERFAAEMSSKIGVAILPVDSADACLDRSDIVITITNSSKPVLKGSCLIPGTHIVAAGSNHWMRRELDDEAVKRCDVVVVDDLDQAKIECGDLISLAKKGIIGWEGISDLSEVISGCVPGRTSDTDITLFESQGLALEDVAVSVRVYEIAREIGIGQELFLS